MTSMQIIVGLLIGAVALAAIITLLTLFLKKFVPHYYKKIDKNTTRIYTHPLGNSDIPIKDAVKNLKRTNSFAQKKNGSGKNDD